MPAANSCCRRDCKPPAQRWLTGTVGSIPIIAKPGSCISPSPIIILSATSTTLAVTSNAHRLALSRLKHYDGNTVVFAYLNHTTQRHQTATFDAEAFIKRFVQHIPDKGFRMLRYYGFLAHRVR